MCTKKVYTCVYIYIDMYIYILLSCVQGFSVSGFRVKGLGVVGFRFQGLGVLGLG